MSRSSTGRTTVSRAPFLPSLAAALLALPAGLAADPIFFDGFGDSGTRGWNTTAPPTCTDGRKNGDETGVDCGGTSCTPCGGLCPAPAFGAMGGPCSNDNDCGGGDSHCYVGAQNGTVYAPEGYCKVDDFTLTAGPCAADDDCAAGAICVRWLSFLPYRSCMPACLCDGEACPAHQMCRDSFGPFYLDNAVCLPGKAGARDGDACAGVFACDEFSACVADAEHPGGECQRRECILGDDATCNGGRCIVADVGSATSTVCVDLCALDGDCRAGDGYRCVDPDGGGPAPSYCRHPHVGDGCATADDCGGGAWVCKTGASYTGGYCTQTGCAMPGSSTGCPAGTVCFDDPAGPTNFCVDRCNANADCRADYNCDDTDPGGGVVLGCLPGTG